MHRAPKRLRWAAAASGMVESLHCLIHSAALLLARDLLIGLDHLLKVCLRTIHILSLLLDHVDLPIERGGTPHGGG